MSSATEYIYIEEYPTLLKIKVLHLTDYALIVRSMDDDSFRFLDDYRTRLYNLSQMQVVKFHDDPQLYGPISTNIIMHSPQIIEGEYMNFIYGCGDEFCFEGTISKPGVVSDGLLKMLQRNNKLEQLL